MIARILAAAFAVGLACAGMLISASATARQAAILFMAAILVGPEEVGRELRCDDDQHQRQQHQQR